jgi:hypothetical protein
MTVICCIEFSVAQQGFVSTRSRCEYAFYCLRCRLGTQARPGQSSLSENKGRTFGICLIWDDQVRVSRVNWRRPRKLVERHNGNIWTSRYIQKYYIEECTLIPCILLYLHTSRPILQYGKCPGLNGGSVITDWCWFDVEPRVLHLNMPATGHQSPRPTAWYKKRTDMLPLCTFSGQWPGYWCPECSL